MQRQTVHRQGWGGCRGCGAHLPAIANNKAEEVDSGVMMVIVPPLAARSSDTNQPDVNVYGFKPGKVI